MKKKVLKIIKIIIICIVVVLVALVGFQIKESIRINSILKSHKIEQTSADNNVVIDNNQEDMNHITTAVQQIMIGTMCTNYDNALQTLRNIKDAGYEVMAH